MELISSRVDDFSNLSEQSACRYLAPAPLKRKSRRELSSPSYIRRAQAAGKLGIRFSYQPPATSIRPRNQHPNDRRIGGSRVRLARTRDWDESEDLARSGVPLPSDKDPHGAGDRTSRHVGLVRRPTLERQEAFLDATTAKPRGCSSLSRSSTFASSQAGSDDGIHSARFSLSEIVHDEPQYTVRQAKRTRKFNSLQGYNCPEALPLELSFAQLCQDEEIAQFLISPDPSEVSDDDDEEEPIQHRSSAQRSFSPLRVIYELASSNHTHLHDNLDEGVPDLVSDNDEDFDWAVIQNDTELDQGETSTTTPSDAAAAWIVLDDDS